MRRVQALVLIVTAALASAAASSCGGEEQCDKDVFGDCTGAAGGQGGSGATGGSGGATTTATPTGGAGGTPCVVADCPPGDDCREAVCLAGLCALSAIADGTPCGADGGLQCAAGVCQGCTAPEQCSPEECRTVACTGGACVYTVDTTLTCGANGQGTCTPDGVCADCADGKLNGDETDVDCGGTCGPTCTIGQACVVKDDCESDSSECVQGVCCDTACADACFTCVLPGREGLCLPFAGTDAAGCSGVQACSPTGVCSKASGQGCAAPTECASGLCTGGLCADCGAAIPCEDGQVCVGSYCVAGSQPQGTLCAGHAACESGFCVDGVCCDATCDGSCQGCNTAYTQNQQGHCYFVISGYDPQSECNGPGLAGVCNGNGECGDN